MITVRCQYCRSIFSIDDWQKNNCICTGCNVLNHERRYCQICHEIFRAERRSKSVFCPDCRELAIEMGLVPKTRKIEAVQGIKTCLFCGTPFPYVRSNALYCTERCRKQLEHKRRKEKYLKFLENIKCQSYLKD